MERQTKSRKFYPLLKYEHTRDQYDKFLSLYLALKVKSLQYEEYGNHVQQTIQEYHEENVFREYP